MSNQIHGNGEPVDDQAVNKDAPAEMISVARRWIIKTGLTAPVILTLRSKPAFGQRLDPDQNKCSASMSASHMSASYALSGRPRRPNPAGCVPDPTKKQ